MKEKEAGPFVDATRASATQRKSNKASSRLVGKSENAKRSLVVSVVM
jgi:hypothetical protein